MGLGECRGPAVSPKDAGEVDGSRIFRAPGLDPWRVGIPGSRQM